MEKDRKRALRRWKSRNKWYSRIKEKYAYDRSCFKLEGPSPESVWGICESWKEVLDIKWSKLYKNTPIPFNCWLSKMERYKRVDFTCETKRMIKEELFD